MTGPTRPATASSAKGGGSGRAKAAAARREKSDDDERTITFRGVTLALPKLLAGTLYFDFADLREDQGNPATHIRMLKSLIGHDQVELVRAKIAEDEVPFSEMDTIIFDLLNAAMAAYGMTSGESSASPGS